VKNETGEVLKKPLVIGLTGYYCAGKNHVARFFEQRGLPVLDLDKLGHEVVEKEKDRLLALFGGTILGKDGYIDRKLLGARVFGRPAELAALEDIIHPAVNRETIAWISSREEDACVINAALLHRSSAFETLDTIILVEAPLIVRLLRAKRRDKLGWIALLKRIRSQRNFFSQYYAGKTDIYRVENSGYFGSQKKLEIRVGEILSLKGIIEGISRV
jgi:dephospho-CoA kinase